MKKASFTLIVFLYQAVAFTSVAQKSKVASAEIPVWVKAISIEYNNPQLEKQAEDGYLDVAFIKQVNVPLQTNYYRKAFKIINEQGVENISEVSVSYDPAYQKLVFHSIKIIRDGRSIDKFKAAKFRVLQQETDAHMHMYNGSLTALLVLDDVRSGDIIEYDYSIKGYNPVFEGRYADYFSTAFSVPFGQFFYRLITDADRPIYFENINLEYTPKEKRNGNQKEYEWSFSNLAALHSNDNLPSWYNPYPTVMISEYNDWLNIREWAERLFPNKVVIEKPLQQKINSIKTANSTNDQRAVAALRFVQDEIRYLGIEMGTGTHRPANPNKTFSQRFGDCKDKSYLLVTMLTAMGIDATPVLINSSEKHSISQWLPSPIAFDHVTVRFQIDGKQYYVDPTITSQRGSLATISYPDYQAGLVLADSSSGITTISTTEPGMVSVKEVFIIPDMRGSATLKVTTVNTGTFADDARSAFKNNSVFEMQKTFQRFYASYFEKIKADSISYDDNEQSGAFTVTEYYSIENLWSVENGIKKCGFSGFVISSYLKKPKDKLRTMPMYMYYPAKYHEEVEVNLPEDWSLKDFNTEVSCNVFRFAGKSTLTGSKLQMVFDFETLKDFANPAEIDELLASYKKVDNNLGWDLTYNTSGGKSSFAANSDSNPLSAGEQRNINLRLALFFSILSGAVVFVVVKQKRKKVSQTDLSGFGRDKWR